MSVFTGYNGLSLFPKLSDDLVKQNYPKHLQLVQVQIYHRHGERVPIARKFKNITPETWDYCKYANHFHQKFRQSMIRAGGTHHVGQSTPLDEAAPVEFWKTYREERIFPNDLPRDQQVGAGGTIADKKEDPNDNYYSIANKNTCGWGQLSDVGWSSMRGVGNYLRELYVDRLGYLPSSREDIKPDSLYIRTTDYSRALESVHQVISGLYPVTKDEIERVGEDNIKKIPVFTRTVKDENMFLNYSCQAMKSLLWKMRETTLKMFSESSKEIKDKIISFSTIGKESEKIINNSKAISPVHIIFDSLMALEAHGLKLPDEITHEFVDQLGKQSAKQWLYGATISEKLTRLQTGPIGREMLLHITNKVSQINSKNPKYIVSNKLAPYQKPPEFAIFSGHDTTIGPLLLALGYHKQSDVSDPKDFNVIWPEFGSVISLEVFQDTEVTNSPIGFETPKVNKNSDQWPNPIPKDLITDGFYVRVSYDGKPFVIPTCKLEGNHHSESGPTLCTLDAFFKHFKPYVQTAHEWKTECRLPI
ncbi:hypothetical protein BB559_004568 [Furculomyces boomerangus]|uniref:Acid phosphatase n=2 Tax=Harpellales TaxID=61421 RepID=A0A2T9YDZ2_9FUNG|nr:hypothetical protein BB559_004568 [Furculomyces boomerangus]PVZ96681.1 hypothetical protein BB558_007403 [Smittium angustum]